eukprot:Skav216344  [mRNA]  locus=scaffold2385:34400:36999:+ [translate_table: standard]
MTEVTFTKSSDTFKERAMPRARAVFTAGRVAKVAALRTRSRMRPRNKRLPNLGVPTGGKAGITASHTSVNFVSSGTSHCKSSDSEALG